MPLPPVRTARGEGCRGAKGDVGLRHGVPGIDAPARVLEGGENQSQLGEGEGNGEDESVRVNHQCHSLLQ